MELNKVENIVRFGMAYERARVEVAAHNLAMANVALATDAKSPLQTVSARLDFAGQVGIPNAVVESPARAETRLVHEPTHPLADANGMVHYPKVEPAMEMATLVSATRAYEANIRAYNSLKAMTLKAFEIGK